MGLTEWFGVEATRGKRFKFRLIELVSVAGVPCAGDYSRNAVITMGRRARVGSHKKREEAPADSAPLTSTDSSQGGLPRNSFNLPPQ